ncbi:hypothetical protein G7050_10045 [Dysgonomonas sp. HDW5A]|nr:MULTISPECIES: hypothetical protein [unclassified Dysgonomonas]QIK54730.1 hypothetical protein G7051_10410 [Dysgonomonas sp. HDW5B]QIK60150.1 hypothetical protein G7050_10045 [Dysgonomonas sp. HDW5A]
MENMQALLLMTKHLLSHHMVSHHILTKTPVMKVMTKRSDHHGLIRP